MKKIYTIIAIMLLTAGAFAQTSDSRALPTRQMVEVTKSRPVPGSSNLMKSVVSPFWIDLDSADSFNQNSLGVGYSRFLWKSNMHYVEADTSTGNYGLQNAFYVTFDTIVDSYNSNGPTWYSHSNNPTIKVDSIFLWCGQVNFSTIDDSLVIKILPVINITGGIQGFPDTTAASNAAPLWDTTIFIPASAPFGGFNSTLNGAVILIAPNKQLATNKFCVKMEYWGNKQDTFMFVAGCPSFAGANQCAGFTMADSSSYHPNSYCRNVQFGQVFPTKTDGFVYYECNGVNGFQYGLDGFDYIQNIALNVKVSGVHSAGIQENKELGIKLGQNMPNPFNNTSDITYELAKRATVTLSVTDLAGRNIMTINQGAKDAGVYKITLDGKDFAQGVYFYTLNVDGVKLTNKMIVTK